MNAGKVSDEWLDGFNSGYQAALGQALIQMRAELQKLAAAQREWNEERPHDEADLGPRGVVVRAADYQ